MNVGMRKKAESGSISTKNVPNGIFQGSRSDSFPPPSAMEMAGISPATQPATEPPTPARVDLDGDVANKSAATALSRKISMAQIKKCILRLLRTVAADCRLDPADFLE